MHANPGGQIAPADVVGRDALIARLWRILARQSLVLTAERRMGKTTVVKKMVAEPPDGTIAVYRDLEALRTPLEFVEAVLADTEAYLRLGTRAAQRARQFLQQLGGAQVGGVRLPEVAAAHWKPLLAHIVADLADPADQGGRRLVLFWDEMPLMLDNIRRHASEAVAMEILDTLRALRQGHPSLRMVFTGSVGLHIVLSGLRRGGHANDPTNDMHTEEVPELAPADAHALAYRLLAGEDIARDGRAEVATAIAEAVDGMPYYIHHVVDRLALRGGPIGTDEVGEVVDAGLADPNDPWHLHYYRERIDTYYGERERPLALAALDALAVAPGPRDFDDLFEAVKARLVTEETELMRAVLTLLERDHYIRRDTDGAHAFRFPLIQRYWRLHRGLRP